MEIGTLFLKSNSTGIITFSELDWITTHQSNFTRLEESIAIKLGRIPDLTLMTLARTHPKAADSRTLTTSPG